MDRWTLAALVIKHTDNTTTTTTPNQRTQLQSRRRHNNARDTTRIQKRNNPHSPTAIQTIRSYLYTCCKLVYLNLNYTITRQICARIILVFAESEDVYVYVQYKIVNVLPPSPSTLPKPHPKHFHQNIFIFYTTTTNNKFNLFILFAHLSIQPSFHPKITNRRLDDI